MQDLFNILEDEICGTEAIAGLISVQDNKAIAILEIQLLGDAVNHE